MDWHTIWGEGFLLKGICLSFRGSIGGGYSIVHTRSATLSRFVFCSRSTALYLISTSCTWCFSKKPLRGSSKEVLPCLDLHWIYLLRHISAIDMLYIHFL